MINIAICDDEEYFRELLRAYIEEYMDDKAAPYAIELFDSGRHFLERGADILKYQIIFLDINMEGMDGIETAKLVRRISKQSYLVFVTAYMDYTLEGYKVDAVRYILKRRSNLRDSLQECMDAIFERMATAIPLALDGGLR